MAASFVSTPGEEFKVDLRKYWTNRDYKTSSRLFMQHWMWTLELGFTLHPAIPASITSKGDLKIADVGCGNGAWLMELVRTLPDTVALDGFDISTSCFGSEEWLPSNLRLIGDFDAMESDKVKAELVGKYDIVHVRAFGNVVKENDAARFIKTLFTLLKPGGYLQWEESNPALLAAKIPNENVQSQAAQNLVHLLNAGGARSGLTYDWMTDIESELQSEGLDVVAYRDVLWRPELQKGWNDNLLTVYEEIGLAFPSVADAPSNAPMTKEAFQELFSEVLQECKNGVWFHLPSWALLAQKNK